jgi:adenosylhomocysteine nucleosidase
MPSRAAPPNHILICFAVIHEAKPLIRLIRGNGSVHCLVTGMGRKNSEENFKKRISVRKPELVITSGFAGGLNPALVAGQIVFSADPDFPLPPLFCQSGARSVRFHCAERIAVTPREKAALREQTGADAVEMESGWIRAICLKERIPSATVRIISDAAEEELPLDFNRYLTKDYKLNYLKLAGSLAIQPSRWKSLLNFQKQTHAAAQRLGETLVSVVSA